MGAYGMGKIAIKFFMFGYSVKQIGVIISIGIVSILLLGALFGDSQPLSPTQSQDRASENASSQQKETSPVIKIDDGTFLVTRVIDGDTIELENGQRIRYIGIDTPETVDPRKPVQCFGLEASKKNKELVEGKRVRLEKDITDSDRYGRLLRYVYINNVFINLTLVQEGFAYSYTYPPDIKFQNQLVEAERIAREQKKGLWESCPIASPTPAPTPVTQPAITPSPTSSCNIKGNITTEKIYHLPGCASYDKTQIDEARGERWFCTEAEAVSAGWRKAKNCP